jgi:hypothetical protein
MSSANPLWGVPRIHGELLKLGIEISQATVAKYMVRRRAPMAEFAQSVPNLTEASTNLYELLKGRNLVAYADEDLHLAVSRCVASESSRRWRIAKEKASHKIDVVVALAQAALGAVQQGQVACAPQNYSDGGQ